MSLTLLTKDAECWVVIDVEASTIAYPGSIISESYVEIVSGAVADTPCFDVVGRVVECEPEAIDRGIRVGDRVATLTPWSGNQRYVRQKAHKVVKVPRNVDAAEAASLVVTYMTAFQSLNVGRGMERYTESYLEGKQVLVTGGMTPVGAATIDLALKAKAAKVYATEITNHHKEIKALGAIPLDWHPVDWLPRVRGKMDYVIDSTCHDDYTSSFAALNDTGHLVCCGMSAITRHETVSLVTTLEVFFMQTVASSMPRTSFYGVLHSWRNNRDEYKLDLEYLFMLLLQGKIKPRIARRIPASALESAYLRLRHERVRNGGILCCVRGLDKTGMEKESLERGSSRRRKSDDGVLEIDELFGDGSEEEEDDDDEDDDDDDNDSDSVSFYENEDIAAAQSLEQFQDNVWNIFQACGMSNNIHHK